MATHTQLSLQRIVVDAKGGGQGGTPVAVCITVFVKKPLPEETAAVTV